jgi:hypothetical protein
MKLGIMQPYLFPYIGYFHLIHAVDKFVLYDDVSYIKQGWINRNKILLNSNDFIFTVPLKNASSYATIRNTEINHVLYNAWRTKFLKTLAQAYAKAPAFPLVYDLVAAVLNDQHDTICSLASASITATSNYLGITTEFVLSATTYNNNNLKAKDRIIDICKKENAAVYINVAAGKELYSKDEFAGNGITLNFIKSRSIAYQQFNNEFVPWLSIIDVMMFNKPGEIMYFLNEYNLD